MKAARSPRLCQRLRHRSGGPGPPSSAVPTAKPLASKRMPPREWCLHGHVVARGADQRIPLFAHGEGRTAGSAGPVEVCATLAGARTPLFTPEMGAKSGTLEGGATRRGGWKAVAVR
jgi:hypothetical protein